MKYANLNITSLPGGTYRIAYTIKGKQPTAAEALFINWDAAVAWLQEAVGVPQRKSVASKISRLSPEQIGFYFLLGFVLGMIVGRVI